MELRLDSVPRTLSALGLLDLAEIVDGDLDVVQISRRNQSFRVRRTTGCGYVMKCPGSGLATAHTSSCEQAFYAFAAADPRVAALRVHLPRMVHAERGLIVTEYIAARPAARPLGGGVAAELGAALARLHAIPVDDELVTRLAPIARSTPWILQAVRPVPELLATISSANAVALGILRAEPVFEACFDELARTARHDAFVHGDIKSDNLLVREQAGAPLAIVDWELVHFGDRAWDLGCAFYDLLAPWLYGAAAATPAPGVLAGAQVAIRALWSAYLAASPSLLEPGRELLARAIRFAAARLVQGAYELDQFAYGPSRASVLHVQAAANIFADADGAARTLFGIR